MTKLGEPGDFLEGTGILLRHGRIITRVDYHLAVPTLTHFLVNRPGELFTDYGDDVGGFILVRPKDAEKLEMADYTLELAEKNRISVTLVRPYKQIERAGESWMSFWITAKAVCR
jgi:hypothetical protein